MSWINLAATRFRLRADLRDILDHPEDLEIEEVLTQGAVEALLVGDRALIEEAAQAIKPHFEAYLARLGRRADWMFSARALHDVFTPSVLLATAGEDVSASWRWIADTRPGKDRLLAALRPLVLEAIAGEPSPRGGDRVIGHVEDDAQWLDLVAKAPYASLLDLATAPDHPRWPTLELFVAPLALLTAAEAKSRGEDLDLIDLCSLGSSPDRHRDVFYERQHERPPFDVEVDEDDPSTWFGFDAVERVEDELAAYHFVGLRWKAPLLLEEDLDSFAFLEWVDLDWRLVEETVSPDVWKVIDPLRRNPATCRHVVVYDSAAADCYEEDLPKVAARYGLRVEAADLMAL